MEAMISERKKDLCYMMERLKNSIQEGKQRFIILLRFLAGPRVNDLDLPYLVISARELIISVGGLGMDKSADVHLATTSGGSSILAPPHPTF